MKTGSIGLLTLVCAAYLSIPFIKDRFINPYLLSAEELPEDHAERERLLRSRFLQKRYEQSIPQSLYPSETFQRNEQSTDYPLYDLSHSRESYYNYLRYESLTEIEDIPEGRGYEIDYGAVKLRIYGRADARATYGYSFYPTRDDRLNDTTVASSDAIRNGFDLNMDMKVSIKGKIGRKVTVDIDFDRQERQTENTFKVQYKALRRREFVQEVTVGNIDLQFPDSEYAVFEKKSKKTVGLESKMRRGKLTFHTIATLTQGESAVDRFSGTTRTTSSILPEYTFARRKYYQLEPFLFYGDGCNPAVSAASYDRTDSARLNTLTSAPDDPAAFIPTSVDITEGTLTVWLDDRDPRNDAADGAQAVNIGGAFLGNFHNLIAGTDYIFNYRTGRLTFLRYLQDNHKVFVQYSRSGGTCDPTARTSGSVIETFIKWDGPLHEDTAENGGSDLIIIDDDVTNLDIYEVRGVYDLGADNIREAGFEISLIDRNYQALSRFTDLGNYNLDLVNGIIAFDLREPFKNLQDSNGDYYLNDSPVLETIYTERQPSFVGENSEARLRLDFSSEVRNYRLSHSNILQNTVRVRVNGRLVPESKYYIDYNSGYFTFIDPSDPLIGQNTDIQISYEYSPFGSSNEGYIVGLRSEYEANRNVKLGSTVLYNGQFEPSEAPRIGEEPISRMILETDLAVDFNDERLTRLVNTVPGADFDLLPVEVSAYGEYARSYYNPNTFGLGLIDDMESSEESAYIEISAKDWMLGSFPVSPAVSHPLNGADSCNRAPLYYRYYRDPADLNRGLLPFSSGSSAAPAYSTLAGPYNVAEGHLDNEQLNVSKAEKQVSLVYDFDFSAANGTGTPYISAMTRSYSQQGADFSPFSYLEFNARLIDAVNLSSGVRIYFEIGTVSEDSDADGLLDTEDVGLDGINNDLNNDSFADDGSFTDGERNGVLDSERDSGRSEDRGFTFNPAGCSGIDTVVGAGPDVAGYPATRGNGVLDSEDLNRDGTLNTSENTVLIGPDSLTYLNYEQGSDNLLTPGDWQLFRVYIDQSKLSEKQLNAFRQVRTIRMIIVPEAAEGSGKLLISSMRFAGSKWRQTSGRTTGGTDEALINNSSVMRVSMIDNFSSKDEYKAESFLELEKDTYEELHGKRTNTEYARTREAALKMTYTLGTYDRLLARRNFLNTMDLRFYRKMNVWVNYRSLTGTGNRFIFRIGSSEDDYLEFKSPVDRSGWQKLQFNFNNPDSFTGSVNMREINMLQVGVESDNPAGTGEIWINEMYVSDPAVQSDDAYKYNVEVKIKKPLAETPAGVPILSDIRASYEHKHRGRDFASIGQTETNFDEDIDRFLISSKILPFWQADYSFNSRITEADPEEVFQQISLQGFSENVDHATTHVLKFDDPNAPVIRAGYQHRNFRSLRFERLNEQGLLLEEARVKETVTRERSHAPTLAVTEQFPRLWIIKTRYELKTNFRFFSREQTEFTPAATQIGGGAVPSEEEYRAEKEQSENTVNSLNIQIGPVTVAPSYTFKHVRLLDKNYTDTSNLETVGGNFYTPFFEEPADFRYRQRDTAYELKTDYRSLWIFSPSVTFSGVYQESSFRDNLLTYQQDKFQRLKSPSTTATTRLSIPFRPAEAWSGLSFLQEVTPSFNREVTLTETAVPFTRKTQLYEDPLGFKRTMPEAAERAFNLIRYPVWGGFTSDNRQRNNYSNAREYVQTTSLAPETEEGYEQAFTNYDNTLRLRESINTSARWQLFKPLNLRTNTRLTQDVRRPNLGALPVHNAAWGYSVLQTWNLMQLLDFWFWADKARHSSSLELNYNFDRSKRITENIREDKYTPSTALSFSWYGDERTLSSIVFRLGLNLRIYDYEEYISATGPLNDQLIYEQINVPGSAGLRQQDTGYDMSIEYKTELPGFRRVLQNLTDLFLRYNPRYTARISASLNRYDYDLSQILTKPARDQYILYQKVDINLHANVTGDFDFTAVWDVYRDPNTENIRQEVISFQIGFGARILF